MTVGVHADRGGGGEVRATVDLDGEAAAQVPDLAEQQRVDDLRAAGWRVEGPTETDGGGRRLRAVKSFDAPEGVGPVVEQLAGPVGPFRQFRLTQRRTFWKTHTTLVGEVDLSAGLDGFSDPALRQQLAAAGVDAATVERQLGVPLNQAFHFEVVAAVPGARRTWRPQLGQTVAVRAATEAWNARRIVMAALALASGLALVVLLVRRSRLISWG